jgi:hypothetical protein
LPARSTNERAWAERRFGIGGFAMAKSPARGADFVAKIVKDPKNPPKVLRVFFMGCFSET